jgi:hypothetical protein
LARCKKVRRGGHITEAQCIAFDLSIVADLPIVDLRKAWRDRFGTNPPPIQSRDLLRRLFAWQLQAHLTEGLDSTTERALTKIAESLEKNGSYETKIRRDFSPGVVLTREWKGVIHSVTVISDGFQHRAKNYRSLSDIARMITGTRWSGPRFFGLEQKSRRSSPGTTS